MPLCYMGRVAPRCQRHGALASVQPCAQALAAIRHMLYADINMRAHPPFKDVARTPAPQWRARAYKKTLIRRRASHTPIRRTSPSPAQRRRRSRQNARYGVNTPRIRATAAALRGAIKAETPDARSRRYTLFSRLRCARTRASTTRRCTNAQRRNGDVTPRHMSIRHTLRRRCCHQRSGA